LDVFKALVQFARPIGRYASNEHLRVQSKVYASNQKFTRPIKSLRLGLGLDLGLSLGHIKKFTLRPKSKRTFFSRLRPKRKLLIGRVNVHWTRKLH
jgi:hypothetical protein